MDTERIIMLAYDTDEGPEEGFWVVPPGRSASRDIRRIFAKVKISDLSRHDEVSHYIGPAGLLCVVEKALCGLGYVSWSPEQQECFYFGGGRTYWSSLAARPEVVPQELFQKMARWNDRVYKRWQANWEKDKRKGAGHETANDHGGC